MNTKMRLEDKIIFVVLKLSDIALADIRLEIIYGDSKIRMKCDTLK